MQKATIPAPQSKDKAIPFDEALRRMLNTPPVCGI